MSEDIRIVEINGIKIEVDLRSAKRIDQYKVGDMVKLLKKRYSDNFVSYPAMIVGFDDFKQLPTIVVAYLDTDWSYSSGDCFPIKFCYFNAKSTEVEICPYTSDYVAIEKSTIVEQIDKAILKRQEEVRELEQRRSFFLNNFGKYFE